MENALMQQPSHIIGHQREVSDMQTIELNEAR